MLNFNLAFLTQILNASVYVKETILSLAESFLLPLWKYSL